MGMDMLLMLLMKELLSTQMLLLSMLLLFMLPLLSMLLQLMLPLLSMLPLLTMLPQWLPMLQLLLLAIMLVQLAKFLTRQSQSHTRENTEAPPSQRLSELLLPPWLTLQTVSMVLILLPTQLPMLSLVKNDEYSVFMKLNYFVI